MVNRLPEIAYKIVPLVQKHRPDHQVDICLSVVGKDAMVTVTARPLYEENKTEHLVTISWFHNCPEAFVAAIDEAKKYLESFFD